METGKQMIGKRKQRDDQEEEEEINSEEEERLQMENKPQEDVVKVIE